MRKSRHSTCPTTGMGEDRGEKRVLGARQEHGEAAPLPFARLGGPPPAVGVHDAAHDRQAQARAAPLAVGLAVGVEDVRQRVGGDADARVLDEELELRAGVDQPHDDMAPARGEPDRVGAEVDHPLVEPLRVAEVREVRPEPLVLKGDARLLGLRVDLLDGAVHEPCEVEWSAVELHEPRPQARHLEDLIDEPEQPLGAQPDDVREASLSLRERSGRGGGGGGPGGARQTGAPSATRTAVPGRASGRAASAGAAGPRVWVAAISASRLSWTSSANARPSVSIRRRACPRSPRWRSAPSVATMRRYPSNATLASRRCRASHWLTAYSERRRRSRETCPARSVHALA